MVDRNKDLSGVTVTYNDGEVRRYVITASVGVSGYLSEQAGRSGILTLWGKGQSIAIPVANIRDWTITALDGDDEATSFLTER